MKINGQNLAVDLIQRMQDAHKSEKTNPTKEFQVEALSPTKEKTSVSSLDSKLRVTAEKALKGGFKTELALRKEVLSAIVDERLDGITKTRSDKRKLVKSLEATLFDDPEFGKQIDDMMVMAAKDLASAK